jgi:hypothetical protein
MKNNVFHFELLISNIGIEYSGIFGFEISPKNTSVGVFGGNLAANRLN